MGKIVFLAFLIEDDRPGYRQKIHGEACALSKYHCSCSLIIRSKTGLRLYKYENSKMTSVEEIPMHRKRISEERNFFDEYLASRDFFEYSTQYINNDHPIAVYVRRIVPTTPSFLGFLKRIKKINTKIIFEYPTYPWTDEFVYVPHKTLKNTVLYYFERMFNKHIDKYVYKYTYMGAYDVGSDKYVRIQNAGNASDYPISMVRSSNDDSIILLGVAFVSYWTGYDLIIQAMDRYYKAKDAKDPNIYFNIVGKIDPNLGIEKLISDAGLSEYVSLKGFKTGEALDEEFNSCDLCVNALRLDNKVRKTDSIATLKTVEYCFRGKPQLSRVPLTIDGNKPFTPSFLIQVEDEGVDLREIVDAYKSIEKNPVEIRAFAEKHMSWDIVMKRVYDAIEIIGE